MKTSFKSEGLYNYGIKSEKEKENLGPTTVWKDRSPCFNDPLGASTLYLVQLSMSVKNAQDKKIALNTLILSNVESPSSRLLKYNIFLATLQYSAVF